VSVISNSFSDAFAAQQYRHFSRLASAGSGTDMLLLHDTFFVCIM